MGAFGEIVGAARNFACTMYKHSPGVLIPNPISDVLVMAWDELCDPGQPNEPTLPGLPPPPAPPFQGGQCRCTRYRVVYRLYEIANSGEANRLTGYSVFGEVLGIRKRISGSNWVVEILCRGEASGTCLPSPVWVTSYDTPLNPAIGYRIKRVVIEQVQVEGGGPNNCGNPVPSYPAPEDDPPPNGFTSPPVNITLNNGTDIVVNFNLKPPSPDLPVVSPPPIVVNVNNPSINFPVSFDFNGDVNVGTPTVPPVDLPPEIKDKIDDINDGLDDLKKDWDHKFNPKAYEDDPDVEKKEEPIEGGEKEDDVPSLLGVTVTLTKLPDKAQYGSPTVYFAGWVTFKLQNGYTPREQINFEQSFFLAPPGATGYGVTLTNGSEGDIKVYSAVAEQGN